MTQELEYHTYLVLEPLSTPPPHTTLITINKLQYLFSQHQLNLQGLEYYGKTSQQELDKFIETTQAQFKFNLNDNVGYTPYKTLPFKIIKILDNNQYHIKSQDPRFNLDFQVEGTELYKLEPELEPELEPVSQNKTLAIDCKSVDLNLSSLAIIKALMQDYNIVLYNNPTQEFDYLKNYTCATIPHKPLILITNNFNLQPYYYIKLFSSIIKNLTLPTTSLQKSHYLQKWINY